MEHNVNQKRIIVNMWAVIVTIIESMFIVSIIIMSEGLDIKFYQSWAVQFAGALVLGYRFVTTKFTIQKVKKEPKDD